MKDKKLQQSIKKVLDRDPRVDVRHIRVEVREGVVKLTGRVPSHTSIGVAETIVRKHPGVQEVNNLLLSQYSPLFAIPSDLEVRANVERLLKWKGNNSRVLVEVSQGEVELQGKVVSAKAKENVEEKAKQAEGAQRIWNRLDVEED